MSDPKVAPARTRPARVALLVALVAAGVRGDDSDDFRRLEQMPRERRAALAANLAEFDRLPDTERIAIRRLDRDLERRDEVDRARIRELLRRYHLWVNGLPADQRQALRAAGPAEARMALVRQILQKQAGTAAVAPVRVAGLRIGEFGLLGPQELASLLQTWNKLPDDRRKALAPLRGGKLLAALRVEAARLKLAPPPLPPEVAREFAPRVEADPTLKQIPGVARPAEPEKAAARPGSPYAEFLYHEDPRHRPRAVTPARLAQFAAACPAWLLAMTDPLAPDDARAYLAAVYRATYPFPGEIPDKPAPTATAAPQQRPAPRPQPGGSAVSF